MNPKTFQELSRLAHMYSSGAVSNQQRQSLPVPVVGGSGVVAEFFYATQHARPKVPSDLYPPTTALTMRLTGDLIMIWRIGPRDFGFADDPAQPLGQFGLHEGWTYETYDQRHAQLLASLDTLAPQFALQNLRPDERTVTAARHFLQLFREVSEPPLGRYYEAVGRDFFAWVRQTAH